MGLNNSQQDLILRRREAVSTLRLKRLTQREIVATLPSYNPPIVDERGEPFSLATINGDLKALRKEWRTAANVATADHVAEQMAALEQVERRGWTDGDMATVLRAIALKMKLTGTEAPTKIELDWRKEAERAGYDPDAIKHAATEAIKAAARLGVGSGGGGSVESGTGGDADQAADPA